MSQFIEISIQTPPKLCPKCIEISINAQKAKVSGQAARPATLTFAFCVALAQQKQAEGHHQREARQGAQTNAGGGTCRPVLGEPCRPQVRPALSRREAPLSNHFAQATVRH